MQEIVGNFKNKNLVHEMSYLDALIINLMDINQIYIRDYYISQHHVVQIRVMNNTSQPTVKNITETAKRKLYT